MALTWEDKRDLDEATIDVADSSLELVYPLDAFPEETTARELINGQDGTITGATLARGPNGTVAQSFDGNDDYIMTPTASEVQTFLSSSFSISLWFRATEGSSSVQTLVGGTGPSGNETLLMELVASGSGDQVVTKLNDGNSNTIFPAGDLSNYNQYDGNWHHIGFSITLPSGGSLSSSDYTYTFDGNEIPVSNSTDQGYDVNSINSGVDLAIGAHNNENGGNIIRIINGDMDLVKMWNSRLALADLQSEYNRKFDDGFVHEDVGDKRDNQIKLGYPSYDRGGTGLLAYFPLDEEGGSTTYDYSRNSNDGSTNGVLIQDVSGVFGGSSYNFDGTDDEVVVNSSPSLNPSSNSVTVAVWVNADALSGDNRPIMGKIDSNRDNGYQMFYNDGASSFRFEVAEGGTFTNTNDNGNTPTPSTGTWYHIVGTFDGSTLRVYQNAEIIDEITGISHGIGSNTNDLTWGSSNGQGSRWWDGRLDECRVYDRALSQIEVENLYLSDGNNRTITLPWKTDSSTQDVSNLQLQNLNYKTNDGQITAYVESDTSGDNTVDETSDPISLGASGTFSGGDGTSSNPYKIETLDQLDAVRNDLGAYYELIDDIDASATRDAGNKFTAIGSSNSPFLGQLDGQNHTIKDIDIDGTTTDIGIFQYIGSGGVVKNLKVNSPNVVRSGSTGEGVHAGTIAGQSSSGEIRGCVVTIENSDYIEGRETTGGIVGQSVNGSPMPLVKNCEVIVNSTDGVRHGLASTVVGGIVGINEGEVFECVARGTGTLTSEEEVGGVVGENSGYGNDGGYIEHCVGLLEVAAPNASDAGGLTGQDLSPDGPTINGYAAAVVDSNATNAGAILGDAASSTQFQNTYWDTEATNLETAIGNGTDSNYDVTGETTANMKSFSTFDSIWDISQDIDRSFVWHISPDFNDGYPYIQDLINRYPVGRQTEFDVTGLSTDNDKFRLRLECSTDNPHYSPVIYSAELGQAINNSVILTWDNEDWNSNQNESRVIHDTVGDRNGHVQLGYPTFDEGGSSLKGYWPLNDSNSEIIKDQSNNGYDGEIRGPQAEHSGPFGNTIYNFDGSDDKISIWSMPFDVNGSNGFTCSIWIQPNFDSNDGNQYYPIRFYESDSNNWGIQYTGSGEWRFNWSNTNPKSAVNFNAGDWIHLVHTVASDGTHVGYQNASSITNASLGGCVGTGELSIGAGADAKSGGGFPFDGKIGQVRIYDRALSSSEVQDLYDTATSGGTHTTSRKTV